MIRIILSHYYHLTWLFKEIKFKQNGILNLFDSQQPLNDYDAYLENKLNLVYVSNQFGLVFIAFKNSNSHFTLTLSHSPLSLTHSFFFFLIFLAIKLSTLESVEQSKNDFLQHNLDENEQIVQIHLTCDEILLNLLVCTSNTDGGGGGGAALTDEWSYSLFVYDLATLDLNAKKFPTLVKQLNLTDREDAIVDLCFSPADRDVFAVCTRQRIIELWNLNDDNACVAKNYDALASNY